MPRRLFHVPLLHDLYRFVTYTIVRFVNDRCLQVAASLTYTTLLALVPLFAVAIAIISAFPLFASLRGDLQAFLFRNFLPESVSAMQGYLDTFAQNAGKTGTFGLIGLAVTALFLLNTIQDAFNQIWRVTERRRVLQRLLVFWALLSLGPLLFGLSMSMSGQLFDGLRLYGMPGYNISSGFFQAIAPPVLSLIGFTLFYIIMPDQSVRLAHALIGAAVATILFELLKWGFGVYVRAFPSYQAIYGALSTVPILLLWTYLAWAVALYGAVIAASLPEWRARGHARADLEGAPWRRLAIALSLLAQARIAARHGRSVNRTNLLSASSGAPDEKIVVLEQLAEHHYMVRVGRDRWLLGRDLKATTLFELFRALGLAPPTTGVSLPAKGWQARYAEILAGLDASQRKIMGMSIEELLEGESAAHSTTYLARTS